MDRSYEQARDKILFLYQCELNGMIAENKQREFTGSAMAYDENAFATLQNRFIEDYNKIN